MSWYVQNDSTSFSSFQSQINQYHQHRTDTVCFSQFQTEHHQKKIHHQSPSFGSQFYHKNKYHQDKKQKQQTINGYEKKINDLEEENKTLKKQNQLLKKQNQKCKSNLSKSQHKNEELLAKLNMQEHDELEHKEKYIELVGQVKRLKDSLQQMKKLIQKKDKNSQNLKIQIRQLKKKSQEEQWRQNFVELFLDMMMKISKQIKPVWNQKKKLQISWKMAKNIIKKALSSGIQLPKVINNYEDTTYLSEFSKHI